MNTKDVVYVALFAALTAAVGLFPPFPLPVTGVPLTVQSIGPLLAGTILGAKRGFLSQALFVVLVAVGLPVLAGGRGGFGILIGPTGGFLLAWPLMALAVGYLTERFWRDLTLPKLVAITVIAGLGISNLLGIPWMAIVLGLDAEKAVVSSLAFIPGDLAKAILASVIGMAVRRSYPIVAKERVRVA
jgi:biotin transport system substrate-specific component